MTTAASLPDPKLPWPIVWEGVALIARRESCVLQAYLDSPGNVPTIGWGQTRDVHLGMVWTQRDADKDLNNELIVLTLKVRRMCLVAPTDNQIAALVSCAYNIGTAGLASSSILRYHNMGSTWEGMVVKAFALWNKARDALGRLVSVRGLTLRRAEEAALYLKG